MAINALFLVLSVLYAVLGFSFFFYPTSHVLLGYDSSLLVKFLASSYNRSVIVPVWAGAQIGLASVAFYCTTMPSAHDKAKVARGILFALIGALQANVMDAYAAKQSIFSSPSSTQLLRIGILVGLTAWTFVECFSATADDAQPIRPGGKKSSSHQSTPAPLNNLYLRALALVWAVQGCVSWFAPSHLGLIGLGHPHFAGSVFNAFTTTSLGALLVALSTIAYYGATFQSTHDQAKLARSFLLYLAILVGYDGYALYKGEHGAPSDTAMYAHVGVALVFTILSLVVSFSSTSDEVVNRAVKQTPTLNKQS